MKTLIEKIGNGLSVIVILAFVVLLNSCESFKDEELFPTGSVLEESDWKNLSREEYSQEVIKLAEMYGVKLTVDPTYSGPYAEKAKMINFIKSLKRMESTKIELIPLGDNIARSIDMKSPCLTKAYELGIESTSGSWSSSISADDYGFIDLTVSWETPTAMYNGSISIDYRYISFDWNGYLSETSRTERWGGENHIEFTIEGYIYYSGYYYDYKMIGDVHATDSSGSVMFISTKH